MTAEPELRAEREDAPTTGRDRSVAVLVGVAGAVLVGVVGSWLWVSRREAAPPPAVDAVSTPASDAAEPAPPLRSATSGVLHPVVQADKPLELADIPAALNGVLGGKAAASFLQTDNFPRRFVATVDSLARDRSPSSMWPILPTPGRFLVEDRAEGPVIAPDNAARYTPFVLLASTLDVPDAVGLYRRMYPLLQQAYRELGFGDRYLNDRVVDVIDVLLATPDAPDSPRLELVDVKGPYPSVRPWVRYQFADPQLERLAAGQKVLLRMGVVNERRLKAKLAELRKELLPPPPQPAASQPR
jgi:hypothetical protein